ncbi:hypothetical protein WA026_011085 [Henosepilachna vigintioctopunctata]|uniref:Uncharacterized protein n=1 Tax=Henosepilachna vigintioctopunctata TaxID=420089 RepID=A0AAW1U4U7_9CUCU
MWKNSTASTGRLTSSKKNRKKKGIRSTNNLTVLENKGHNLQQTRWKSSTSWKSKCECEEKPCPTEKRDYDEKANNLYPLPADWDYDGPAPPHLVRKWATRECPPEKDIGCPITSDDMKKGPPSKRPLSAAALNRCNLDECKNRMRRRKGGYRGGKKNYRDGVLNNCDCSNK